MSENKIKTPSLNGDKIVEQYPLSVNVFKEWLGTFPNVEVLGKDALLYEQSLKAIFYFSPRALYDFFDDMGNELVINRVDDTYWSYHIVGSPHSFSADSRVAAEELGFGVAFETLENQLAK